MNMLQKGGKRKTQAPRIDLTPMVDFGFLLITFFMYTTTMAKPRTMELNMPSNEVTKNPTVVVAESTITLLPLKGHKVIYYEGILSDPAQLKECPIGDTMDVLLKKNKEVLALPAASFLLLQCAQNVCAAKTRA